MAPQIAQTAIVQRPSAPPPARLADTAAIIQMIERVALNPNANIDKMERLLQMQERVLEGGRKQAFNQAMSAAQAEMQPIAVDSSNPQTHSKYASFAAIDRAMRPIYTKHGFALSFDTEAGAPEAHIRIVCHVSHTDGHERRYQIDMPTDGKGAKGGDVMTKTHAAGSGMSYGQRYLLKLIFNIAVSADDDGNGGKSATGELLTKNQLERVRDVITQTGANEPKFCAYMKVSAIADLRADQFDAAISALQHWQAERSRRAQAQRDLKARVQS